MKSFKEVCPEFVSEDQRLSFKHGFETALFQVMYEMLELEYQAKTTNDAELIRLHISKTKKIIEEVHNESIREN